MKRLLKVASRKYSSVEPPSVNAKTILGFSAVGTAIGYIVYKQTTPRVYNKPKGNSSIEKQFYEYASIEDNGQWFMNKEDFCRVCGIQPWEISRQKSTGHSTLFSSFTKLWEQRNTALHLSQEQSKSDFEAAVTFFEHLDDSGEGKISLQDFAHFVKLLRSSDADERCIFLLSDLNSDNEISLVEFQKGMKKYVPEFSSSYSSLLDINSSEILQRYFGKDGKHMIAYKEYHQLLSELEEEMMKLDFNKLQKDGKVETKALTSHLIKKAKKASLPDHFLENIHRVQKETGQTEISFLQYRALHNFLKHSPRIEQFIKEQGDVALTKEEFREALHKEKAIRVSNGEVDWVFSLFANPETKKIDSKSCAILSDNLQADAPDSPKMSFFQSLALGGASAMIGVTAVFPLDKVKTRMQSSSSPETKGIFTIMKEICEKEGPRRLYRGLQAELIGITPEKATKIAVNDFIRKKMMKRHETESGESTVELSTAEEMIAGMGCGLTNVFISNPISVVKIRLQMQSKEKTESPFSIVRKLGFRGLYTGLGATILRDVPFSMMYFSIYQGLKSYFKELHKQREDIDCVRLTASELLIASCIAGSIAGGLDTPADGIKTRLQNGEGKYNGIIDCVKKVYAQDGVRGFFRGCSARILIISPFFGITMMCYETFQRFFFPNTKIGLQMVDEDFETIRRSKLHNLDTQIQLRYQL